MSFLQKTRDLCLFALVVPVIGMATAAIEVSALVSRVAARPRPPAYPPIPTQEGTPSLSVVVAASSGTGLLTDCLDSLKSALQFEGLEAEIVVAADQAGQLKARAACPSAVMVPHSRAGTPRGWQAGLEMARGEVVVLIQDSVIPEQGAIAPLLACFADPRVAAATPVIAGGSDPESGIETGRTRGEMRQGEMLLWDAPVPDRDAGLAPVLWVRRGQCAYRRERLLRQGSMDRVYEDQEIADLEIGLRLWREGDRVVQAPGSIFRKRHGASGRESVALDRRERDRLVFAWRNLGSGRPLAGFQLAQLARLLMAASQGRLNIRPLRYALGCLPGVVADRLGDSRPPSLSVGEALSLSSHRLLMRDHEDGLLATGADGQATAVTVRPPDMYRPTNPSHVANGTENEEGRAGNPLRILLVCPQLPYPATHGSAVRMWNLLKVLSARHQVDVLSFFEPNLDPEEVGASRDQLARYCGSVRLVARMPHFSGRGLLDRSIHVEMFDCREMREALLDMVEGGCYDVIQYDKTEMGQYILPRPAPTQLLVEHVIFYLAYHRQFVKPTRPSLRHLVDYLKLRRFELQVCGRADGIITMSPVDTRFLRKALPGHPCLLDVPNGVDMESYPDVPEPPDNHDLLFIGHFDHSPNVDAVRFFLRDVFPRIKESVPDARLLIVGAGPYHTVPEVAAEAGAVPLGFVPDTRVQMAECAVFVAPLLAGSGTRLKILEAMAAGIPIVSTTLGAEGIEVVSGTHMLLADDPGAFARGVISLLRNASSRERLRANARSVVQERYSWQQIGRRLDDVYRRAMSVPPAG